MTELYTVLADAAVSPDPFFSFGTLLIGIPLLLGLAGSAVVGLILLIRHMSKKNSARIDHDTLPEDRPCQDQNTDNGI